MQLHMDSHLNCLQYIGNNGLGLLDNGYKNSLLIVVHVRYYLLGQAGLSMNNLNSNGPKRLFSISCERRTCTRVCNFGCHQNFGGCQKFENFVISGFFGPKLFELLTCFDWIWTNFDQIYKYLRKKTENFGEICACWWGPKFLKFWTEILNHCQY